MPAIVLLRAGMVAEACSEKTDSAIILPHFLTRLFSPRSGLPQLEHFSNMVQPEAKARMRTESENRRLVFFMTTLVVIAFAVNGVVASFVHGVFRSPASNHSSTPSASIREQSNYQPSQQERVEVDRRAEALQAAQVAAEKRAQFLERYLNVGVTRKPGVTTVALVAATENKRSNRALGDALAQRFHDQSVTILPSFFRAEFVTDGLFNDAFNEPSDLPSKLELANVLDGLLVARQSVEYSTNTGLQGVITASMQLEVLALPVTADAQRQTWTFTAYGAGFKPIDARRLAEERLIKQIADDTKMSLAPIHPNNPNQ